MNKEEKEINMEDNLVFTFVYLYGMRTKTIKQIKVNWLDLENGFIHIEEMKRQKIKLRDCDILSLMNYCEDLSLKNDDFLFPNYNKMSWEQSRDRIELVWNTTINKKREPRAWNYPKN